MTDSDFGAYWKAPLANAGAGKTTADFYAVTNVRGHVVKLTYSPYDVLTLSAKWIYPELIDELVLGAAAPEGSTSIHRVQVDAVLKF
jgi:hypothetical protein